MSAQEKKDPAFETLLQYLKGSRGFDFTEYKRASLMRRVNKRMGEVGIEGYEQYEDYLEVHPLEFTTLFNTILINVTSYFRNQEAWDYLADEIVPRILETKTPSSTIRLDESGEPEGVVLLMEEAKN